MGFNNLRQLLEGYWQARSRYEEAAAVANMRRRDLTDAVEAMAAALSDMSGGRPDRRQDGNYNNNYNGYQGDDQSWSGPATYPMSMWVAAKRNGVQIPEMNQAAVAAGILESTHTIRDGRPSKVHRVTERAHREGLADEAWKPKGDGGYYATRILKPSAYDDIVRHLRRDGDPGMDQTTGGEEQL